VKESQHRVESALKSGGFFMPRNKTVVNLAPADIRKEGSAYDLPIALCVLKSSGQIKAENLEQYIIMGELSLDGILRPIKGVLPIAIQAKKDGFKGFILPKENAREAAIVNNLEVLPVSTLKEAVDFLDEVVPLGDDDVFVPVLPLDDRIKRLHIRGRHHLVAPRLVIHAAIPIRLAIVALIARHLRVGANRAIGIHVDHVRSNCSTTNFFYEQSCSFCHIDGIGYINSFFKTGCRIGS